MQNNALEGPLFVPQHITAEADIVQFLQQTFPLFTNDDIAKILYYYSNSNDTNSMDPDYATLGYTRPTQNNQSAVAVGQQARANICYIPPLSFAAVYSFL